MFNKFIFHYVSLNRVDDTVVNAVVETAPIVVLRSFEGKHTQINIKKFNTLNEDKAALPFIDRLKFYSKTFRNAVTAVGIVSYTATIPETSFIFTTFVGGTLSDFVSGITNSFTTGYEGNFLGFFDSNPLDLENEAPNAGIDFNAGLIGN